jgi:hypothetical protein
MPQYVANTFIDPAPRRLQLGRLSLCGLRRPFLVVVV